MKYRHMIFVSLLFPSLVCGTNNSSILVFCMSWKRGFYAEMERRYK